VESGAHLTRFFKHLLFDTLGVNGVNLFLLEKVFLGSILNQDVYSLTEVGTI
jgi:hypothetical protein